MLDEHLRDEPVRVANELLVVLLAHLSDPLELGVCEHTPCFAERAERVLRLTSRYDVANEPEEIALTSDVVYAVRGVDTLRLDIAQPTRSTSPRT